MSINHTFERETFIDREVALALFDCVLGRNPDQPWPFLPILTFIAPSGGGKRTLMEILCDIRNQLQSHIDGNGKDCHLTFPHHH